MKVLGKVLGVALASLIAMPGAQARPRLGLGVALLPLAIVGGIAGAAIGSRKARAHRSHYSRHHARRERGAIRQARPVAPAPEMARAMPIPDQSRDMPAPEQFRAQSAGWAGPLFWPNAYDGVFEYAFGLPGNDGQFWVRGFGDVIDGMFAPPPVRETIGRASNDGVRAWGSLCGSERSRRRPISRSRGSGRRCSRPRRSRRRSPSFARRLFAPPSASRMPVPPSRLRRRPSGCT